MTFRIILSGLFAGPLLAACVAPSAPTPRPTSPRPAAPSAPVPSMTPAAPSASFIPPQIMRGPGLDAVIGRNETALANLFGPPALSVVEGDARKLQFRGAQCVLDIFLYPVQPRAEPSATWIEARRAQTLATRIKMTGRNKSGPSRKDDSREGGSLPAELQPK